MPKSVFEGRRVDVCFRKTLFLLRGRCECVCVRAHARARAHLCVCVRTREREINGRQRGGDETMTCSYDLATRHELFPPFSLTETTRTSASPTFSAKYKTLRLKLIKDEIKLTTYKSKIRH